MLAIQLTIQRSAKNAGIKPNAMNVFSTAKKKSIRKKRKVKNGKSV